LPSHIQTRPDLHFANNRFLQANRMCQCLLLHQNRPTLHKIPSLHTVLDASLHNHTRRSSDTTDSLSNAPWCWDYLPRFSSPVKEPAIQIPFQKQLLILEELVYQVLSLE